MSLNVFEAQRWVCQYQKLWNEDESQLFEDLTTKPVKKEEGNICMVSLEHGKNSLKRIFWVNMILMTCISIQRQC